jgi:hypothetical protein
MQHANTVLVGRTVAEAFLNSNSDVFHTANALH